MSLVYERETLVSLVKTVPDSNIPEIIDFVLFLQSKNTMPNIINRVDLCGLFAHSDISSYEFAANKKAEKELER
ncbi:hypothetical protein FACS1894167_15770 [Synergistales bacterium]|nr:hypothetical protein FACS1894167_15770 [Synergistales bacterium]GHV55846.1 hypothetical protein FACS1894216_19030 [Synergistales bacterium]